MEEMREVNEGGIKSFDALDSREKTIAILGDRWWPQTAKQDGDNKCKRFLCNIWKKRTKGKAGIRWNKVVENIWKKIGNKKRYCS